MKRTQSGARSLMYRLKNSDSVRSSAAAWRSNHRIQLGGTQMPICSSFGLFFNNMIFLLFLLFFFSSVSTAI